MASFDGFMDKTVWRVGRGKRKVEKTVNDIKSAPSRFVEKQVDKVTPKCVGRGGTMRCRGNGKKGKGMCIHGCGNNVL